jgi:hypothetical protein
VPFWYRSDAADCVAILAAAVFFLDTGCHQGEEQDGSSIRPEHAMARGCLRNHVDEALQNRGDAMRTWGLSACCAVAICAGLFAAAPANALSLKACNDEWNAMKANNTVGDKKYADFRKECLARTAAAPAPGDAAAPAAPAAPPAAAKPPPRTRPTAAAPAAPAAAGEAVFPTEVSSKYSSESAGRARMHTCRDQYNENKANKANGGLTWIEKGGGYYSECNKRLKG